PGDLHGITGSPAFGLPPAIAPEGRAPGFEGAGIISEGGPRVDLALGLMRGMRVAFLPAAGAWSDEGVVPGGTVVSVPESVRGGDGQLEGPRQGRRRRRQGPRRYRQRRRAFVR